MRHIPNILSGLRLVMVVVFILFFVRAQYLWAMATYLLAFVTDILDGYLARRNNWVSDVGKVLDPLADKLMLMTALVCFWTVGWLPAILVIVVVVKELIMIIGGAIFYKHNIVVYADWYGKLATGFFSVGVVATLLANFWTWLRPWNVVILCVAAVMAIVALIHYVSQRFSKKGKPDSDQELDSNP